MSTTSRFSVFDSCVCVCCACALHVLTTYTCSSLSSLGQSIEGDRALGLQSLPVAFGVDAAKWLTVGTIDVTQLLVAAYLFYIGETTYALVLLGLIAPQMFFQYKYFLPDPVANDVKYQASAQPFLVFGILDTALAVGHHGPL